MTTTQLDLTNCASVAVLAHDSAQERDTWLAAHPLSLAISRIPGLLMHPGQTCTLVSTYATPTERQRAAEALRTLESTARRKYLRASQAKVRLNKITRGDLGKI